MRRIEYSRRREEASCGRRGELLNRWSGVRIRAPALCPCASSADGRQNAFGWSGPLSLSPIFHCRRARAGRPNSQPELEAVPADPRLTGDSTPPGAGGPI
jgi:hypothetical protein